MIKFKGLVISLIICTAVNILSGCNNTSSTNSSETASETETESRTELFKECTEEELEKARKDVDIIVQALNDRDAEKLKSVLTGIAIQDTKHLDEEIQNIFDMVDGEIIAVEEYQIKCDEEEVYDKICSIVYMEYTINTQTKEYFLDVFYLQQNDTEADKGVFSFVLGDYDREHEYYLAGYPLLSEIGGVFSSDIKTIYYNENKLSSLYDSIGLIKEYGLVAALELNRVGIEEIKETEVLEITEWGGVKFSLIDNLDNCFYVITDEAGNVFKVCENDENGKILYYPE